MQPYTKSPRAYPPYLSNGHICMYTYDFISQRPCPKQKKKKKLKPALTPKEADEDLMARKPRERKVCGSLFHSCRHQYRERLHQRRRRKYNWWTPLFPNNYDGGRSMIVRGTIIRSRSMQINYGYMISVTLLGS